MKSLLHNSSAFILCLLVIATTPIMAYSNDTNLYDRVDQETVIQLTDDQNTGEVNQAVLDNKRSDVFELINTHLRGRYTVPLEPTPAILANIEADVLVHELYTRRPNYKIPESVLVRKADAMKLLMQINKGHILLEEQPDIAKGAIVSNKQPSDRVFSDQKLQSF